MSARDLVVGTSIFFDRLVTARVRDVELYQIFVSVLREGRVEVLKVHENEVAWFEFFGNESRDS